MLHNFFKTKYRIVTDKYLGYEVQYKYWWWPFWIQAGFTNTHGSIEDAERFAKDFSKKYGQLVKTLDV